MKVVQITRVLTHYRISFHERVRENLAKSGVAYELIYGQPSRTEATRGGFADLAWGRKIDNIYLGLRGRNVVYQPVLRDAFDANLVVLGQENSLLVNYPLQLLKPKDRMLALWGHGKNYQARGGNGAAELWKRGWATKCDWWFAYTQQAANTVSALGFPQNRITVFNNAVDTGKVRSLARATTPERIAALKAENCIHGDNVAIFVGGLYADKRLSFLFQAADAVRRMIPDFHLVIVGDGPDRNLVEELARDRPWVRFLGARFGDEKTELMCMSNLFLMPGLVGLGILDSAAAALPLITTDYPYHSPEIAYLKDGENGLIVSPWQDADSYAGAVVNLLKDRRRLADLSAGASAASEYYTIEKMAALFSDGVLSALEAGPRKKA